jgi:hypothetical protein
MNDVGNLMSKLKFNVAYQQFEETSKPADLDQGDPAGAQVETPAVATGAETQPEPAPTPAPPRSSMLSRYRAAPAPAAPAARTLADLFARLERRAG